MPARSISLVFALSLSAFAAAPEGVEFFEKRVRPLLAEQCLECHTAGKKTKGGLALDSRAGWQAGGDSGAAIVPGKVEESLLIKAVRYTDTNLQMPEKRKLPAAEIAVLEQWVAMGAPDPREGAAVAKKQTGMSLEDGRKFWSFVPPRKAALPPVKDAAWPRNAVDYFVPAAFGGCVAGGVGASAFAECDGAPAVGRDARCDAGVATVWRALGAALAGRGAVRGVVGRGADVAV